MSITSSDVSYTYIYSITGFERHPLLQVVWQALSSCSDGGTFRGGDPQIIPGLMTSSVLFNDEGLNFSFGLKSIVY